MASVNPSKIESKLAEYYVMGYERIECKFNISFMMYQSTSSKYRMMEFNIHCLVLVLNFVRPNDNSCFVIRIHVALKSIRHNDQYLDDDR
jgi:hypothetical protein